MAKDPKVTVQFTGDASKLKRSAGEAEKALGGVEKSTSKLGDAARDHLGPFGEAAENLGIDLDKVGTSGLIAGAAVAGVTAFVADGVRKLSAMTDEVRKFKDASGLSWEESSRLVAVMDDLGIAAEDGAGAMGRLAKNIDAGKLEEFGIQVERTAGGSVDMNATLGNVADSMNATVDPTKRATVGNALFGKSWATLAPLLQQGSRGIEDMTAGVKDYQIVTAESAQEQRDMAMAVDDLQDAVSGLQMSMAKGLIPELAQTAANLAKVVDAVNAANKKVPALGRAFDAAVNPIKFFRDTIDDVRSVFDEQDSATRKAADAVAIAGIAAATATPPVQDLADAERDAAKNAKDVETAIRDQKKAMDDAYGVVTTVADAVLNFANAQARTRDALAEVEAKQRDATTAVVDFGESSPEAIKAQQDYEQSVRDAESAAIAQAKAEVDKATKLAEAEGRTLTAQEKTDIYTKSLGGLKDATNDPTFKSGMEDLVKLTGDAATNADNAQRKLWDMAAAASAAAAAVAAADSAAAAVAAGIGRTGGGDMASTTADAADRILSNQRAPAAAPVINVNSPLGRPEDVISWMRDELRRADRAER